MWNIIIINTHNRILLECIMPKVYQHVTKHKHSIVYCMSEDLMCKISKSSLKARGLPIVLETRIAWKSSLLIKLRHPRTFLHVLKDSSLIDEMRS